MMKKGDPPIRKVIAETIKNQANDLDKLIFKNADGKKVFTCKNCAELEKEIKLLRARNAIVEGLLIPTNNDSNSSSKNNGK